MIDGTNLIKKSDFIIVAVSGGADSVCLLHLLAHHQSKPKLHVAHLNHQIRGKEADGDAQFVQDLARSLDLPVTVETVNVPKLAEEKKLSLEDAARQTRYDFLINLAVKIKANKIATAHTADDQAETVLMRLMRGSGTTGLLGIPAQSQAPSPQPLMIIRPLLNVWRKEVEEYCQQNHLDFRTDSTNKDTAILRNKIRLELIPYLKEYNPNIKETLLRMSEILLEEEQYLEDEAKRAFKKVVQKENAGAIQLDHAKLCRQPKAIQRRMVRMAIEAVKGDLNTVSLDYVENFLENQLTTVRINSKGMLATSKEKI
jgi:tRNA(Ile)-lysidine synthase